MGHLADELFEKVDVLGDISPMDVTKCLYGVTESLATLLGEAVVPEAEFFAGAPTIEFGSFAEVSDRRSRCTKHGW